MDQPKDFLPITRSVDSDNCTASGTSEYSTCSDNPRNVYKRAVNSEIVAGQIIVSGQRSLDETDINSTAYSVDLFEKNIDTEDDIFEECLEENETDITQYLQIQLPANQLRKKETNQSAANQLKIKQTNRFYQNYLHVNNLLSEGETSSSNSKIEETQVLKETNVTYRNKSAVVTNKSQINYSNTADLVVDRVTQIANQKKSNDNCIKRVLFANEESIINGTQENNKTEKSGLKKSRKTCNSVIGKTGCSARMGKDINENRNNHQHNTTESFVMWEKYLASSDKGVHRRSLSLGELNSITESYGGDDEHSTSYKTIDQTILSSSSVETSYYKIDSKKKNFSHKSKSCDDLLKEVKHLPHLIYQKFLRCLSKEIDCMLKQNVICTCERSFKKRSNKENNFKDSNCATHKPTRLNKNSSAKEKTPSKLSPKPSSESKLTPERLLKNPSKNSLQKSPKSPNKTPTKKMYGWKEIVSPVGEYIRGKRQSPFQSSPNKKKV